MHKTQTITEKELLELFSGYKKVRYFNVWWLLVLFVALSIVFTLIMNYRAISTVADFWFSTKVNNVSYEQPLINQVIDNTATVSEVLPDVPLNSIFIDKINVKAPVTFDVNNDTASVDSGLKNGVIQLKNTAHPGEIGNVFITGHSSNYFWEKGDYSSIFALLNNLENGDNVVLNYKNSLYFYKIRSKAIVAPTDLTPLNQSSVSELTLMTCYPVGTNLKRLIVKADQVRPDPKTNQKKTTGSSSGGLPQINR